MSTWSPERREAQAARMRALNAVRRGQMPPPPPPPTNHRDILDEARELLASGLSVVEVAQALDLPRNEVSDLKFRLQENQQAARNASRSRSP
ncbi:MAG TPA: hypothetical protein VNZ61_08860 [Roseomonas sp.]|nr:hypothetical protein [Roseomonas sp.]